jgi:hypothetical protein
MHVVYSLPQKLGCDRKTTPKDYFADALHAPQLSPLFPTTNSGGTHVHESMVDGGSAMLEDLEREIRDTAPYAEWLGIVGSMAVAALVCAVLFSGGIFT